MQTLCDGGGINEVTSTQATSDVLVDVSHLHGVLREKQVHITFHSHADIHDSAQDHKMQREKQAKKLTYDSDSEQRVGARTKMVSHTCIKKQKDQL